MSVIPVVGAFITPPIDLRQVEQFLERVDKNGCAAAELSGREVRMRMHIDCAPLKKTMFRVYGPKEKVIAAVYGSRGAYYLAVIAAKIEKIIERGKTFFSATNPSKCKTFV